MREPSVCQGSAQYAADNESPAKNTAGFSGSIPKDKSTTAYNSKKVKSNSSGETSVNQRFDPNERVELNSTASTSRIAYINERRHRHQGNNRYVFQPSFGNFPRDSKETRRTLANDEPAIIHHSFVSELPDVIHMERALLRLLDDFHSGKLKAFGANNTMEQMMKIREQQENLAKLHFEMAATDDDPPYECKDEESTSKAQAKMASLLDKLEELSISVEKMQSSHIGNFYRTDES